MVLSLIHVHAVLSTNLCYNPRLFTPGIQGVEPVMRQGHQGGHGRLGAEHALAHGDLLSWGVGVG